MVFKNGLVWNGKTFEKKDFYVSNGIFTDKAEGEIIDLTGNYVMPGFVDSHAHVIGTGLKLLTHDLEKESIEDILKVNEEFIIGRGWENLPDISIFQKLQKPVFLIRRCGHKAFINDFLKKKLNLKENIITENAIEKVWKFFGDDLYEKAFKIGEKEFIKHGITFVHSDDFHGISFEKLIELLKNSKLRIFEKLYTFKPWKYEFKRFNLSKIGGIKLFADGSLGARTAYVDPPYLDTKTHGNFYLPSNMKDIVKFAIENNIQLNIHAIGNKALKETLKFIKNTTNQRIIHAQFIDEEDLQELKKHFVSIQPHFYFEDQKEMEVINGPLKYPYKKLFDMKIRIAFSSDSPVSPLDPKYIIESAMKLGFSFHESVYLYTESGAKMVKEKVGKIQKGFYSDFVVYPDHPLKSSPIAVYINGERRC